MNFGMVKLSDFFAELMPRLPGCGTDTILTYLSSVCRQFSGDTESLFESLPSINIVADQRDYAIAPTINGEIIRVKDVRINTAEGIAANQKGTSLSLNQYEYSPRTGLLTLLNPTAVAVTSGLEVDVSVFIKSGTMEVPTWWMNLYENGLKSGCLYEIQRIPNRAYSDPAQAQANQRTYNVMVARARNDVENQYKAVVPRINLNACTDRVGSSMWGFPDRRG